MQTSTPKKTGRTAPIRFSRMTPEETDAILAPAERDPMSSRKETTLVALARYNPGDIYKEHEWVIEGLAARKTLIGWIGAEKSLKPIIGYIIAMHIACGKDFWGLRIPKPRRVVYFDAENPPEEINLRYKAMLSNFSPEERKRIGENLAIVKGRELINEGVNIEWDNKSFWENFRRAYPAQVYFLDALQMFNSVHDLSNRELKKVLVRLRSNCGPENCLFVMHHTRKREDREINRKRPILMRDIGARIWSDKCIGAGVFKRIADTIVCQERAEIRNDDGEVTDWTVDIAAFGRIIDDIPLLQFVPDGDYWLKLIRQLRASVRESFKRLQDTGGPWQSKNAAAHVLMKHLCRSQANIHVNELVQKQYLRAENGGGLHIV